MRAPIGQSKSAQGYSQPTKNTARALSLKHAVELLTSRREDAAVVPGNYIERLKNAKLLSDVRGDATAAAACRQSDIDSWKAFRANAIGVRTSDSLTVAYLAGPEPSNDLLALIALGVRPENIWAFEIDPQSIASGIAQLTLLGLRGIKFIPASMDEYLIGTPRRFDIIYVDACGPLPSDKQKTVRLIVDIFRHGALAPLGVLISNFSRPDTSQDHTLKAYTGLVASYLFPKDFMEKDGRMLEGAECDGFYLKNVDDGDKCFTTEVGKNFDSYYGSFITRHIIDIAEIVAPTVRLASSKLYKVLFDEDLKKSTLRGRRFTKFNKDAFAEDDSESEDGTGPQVDMDGEAITDASMFTLVWTLAALGFYEVDENFEVPEAAIKRFATSWKNQLCGSPSGSFVMEDLIAAFYAWRHDPSLWSPAMKSISNFPYHQVMPFLCDVPSNELGFYPAFAQLAYPAHANIKEIKRWRYVAEGKTTPMFLDVIAFDECRYVYDWISAMHLIAEDWFDLSSQLTFRFALDAIAKERRWFGSDFLVGCHAIGEGKDFPTAHISPRINL